jgi:transposase
MEGLLMKAYSVDLRKRVLADCDAGMEVRQVGVKYNVSESWIRRLRQRRRENDEIAPRIRRSREPGWIAIKDQLIRLVTAKPDATLAELKQELQTPLSLNTLCRALQKLKLTVKKKSSVPPSKTGRMSPRNGAGGGRGRTR